MFGGMSPPMITNSMKTGAIIVRHREYIGDIISSTVFLNRNFPINPGMVGTFPWLAQIANAFEQYRFRGLIFEFKSLSADALISASTNIGQGTVIMATQYNALSPGFSTKIEMENYEYANSCKPSCSFMHPVECALYQTPNTPLYVRNGPIPPNADERLYDLGNFNLATQGLPSASGSIGELWATFEIEFFKPKYTPNSAEGLGADNFLSDCNLSIGQTSIITAQLPMGNLDQGFYAGNIGCRLSYNNISPTLTHLRISFPPASTEIGECFQITYAMANSSGTITESDQFLSCDNANMFGMRQIGTILPGNPGFPSAPLGEFDAPTISANDQQNHTLLCAWVQVTAAPTSQANPEVYVELSGFLQRYTTQSITGRASLFITKLPTYETFYPMNGPTDNTQFGTDV